MAIEHIRLSKQAREQLIRLKRYTGIEHWNALCRWAFCRSLAEASVPPPARTPADSNVEMSWKVFGGRYNEIYMALLKERCLRDGLGTEDDVLAGQFRLHLHRGIAYLASDRRIRKGIGPFMAQVPWQTLGGVSIASAIDNPSTSSSSTRAFYEDHASEYAEVTLSSDMAPPLSGLISRLSSGDSVIDLGCGAGRDLRIFKENRLKPIGIDYSISLSAVARRNSSVPVVVGDLRQLPFANQAFHGASAVASLLHLHRDDISGALTEIYRTLRPGGLLFTSMKRGSSGCHDRHGRWFSYFEKEEWITYLESAHFETIEVRSESAPRKNRFSTADFSWINCLSRKM